MASRLAFILTSKYSLTVLILLLVASSPPCQAAAIITAILEAFPELGEFSSLLASTGLIRDIMGHDDPLTVLALENDDMALIKAMPPEAIRQHLSLHVLLGYYYSDKLGILHPGESVDVSTLYQPSGDAPLGAGMVRVCGPDSGNYWRVSFLPLGPVAGSVVGQKELFVRAMYEDFNRMAVMLVSATMSAPWLPWASAKRDTTGGDAAAVDATRGGAKKN